MHARIYPPENCQKHRNQELIPRTCGANSTCGGERPVDPTETENGNPLVLLSRRLTGFLIPVRWIPFGFTHILGGTRARGAGTGKFQLVPARAPRHAEYLRDSFATGFRGRC